MTGSLTYGCRHRDRGRDQHEDQHRPVPRERGARLESLLPDQVLQERRVPVGQRWPCEAAASVAFARTRQVGAQPTRTDQPAQRRLELLVVAHPQPATRSLAVLARRRARSVHDHRRACSPRLEHDEAERLVRRRRHQRERAAQRAPLRSDRRRCRRRSRRDGRAARCPPGRRTRARAAPGGGPCSGRTPGRGRRCPWRPRPARGTAGRDGRPRPAGPGPRPRRRAWRRTRGRARPGAWSRPGTGATPGAARRACRRRAPGPCRTAPGTGAGAAPPRRARPGGARPARARPASPRTDRVEQVGRRHDEVGVARPHRVDERGRDRALHPQELLLLRGRQRLGAAEVRHRRGVEVGAAAGRGEAVHADAAQGRRALRVLVGPRARVDRPGGEHLDLGAGLRREPLGQHPHRELGAADHLVAVPRHDVRELHDATPTPWPASTSSSRRRVRSSAKSPSRRVAGGDESAPVPVVVRDDRDRGGEVGGRLRRDEHRRRRRASRGWRRRRTRRSARGGASPRAAARRSPRARMPTRTRRRCGSTRSSAPALTDPAKSTASPTPAEVANARTASR